ncbi:MAG TPA: hypothetical protein H9886_03435 [Candidatus Faecalicoccus intestinipullorum]|nr:hypothetical protein [Candidatus Faecalicoccus intestinipullorum]
MAKKNRKYGARFTALLGILFIVLFSVLWALFISGPNRIQEENQERMIAQIEKNNPDIQGLTIHQFDYLTAQGYTETTLYWFDATGNEITTRDISTLDYQKARDIASEDYGIEAESVELGYGYDNPVYVIQGADRMLLLDYDSFVRVYEREVQ